MAINLDNILTLNGNGMYGQLVKNNFVRRPIGLVDYDYDFIVDHVKRGIGNQSHEFDGFSTPIGYLADVDYNTKTSVPWFYNNDAKRKYSNYLRYVEGEHNVSLDLHSSFDSGTTLVKLQASKPIVSYATGGTSVRKDTYTGELNRALSDQFLSYAAAANSERLAMSKQNFKGHSISKDIYSKFGWNSDTVAARVLGYNIDDKTGRVSVPSLADTVDNDYGTYKKLVTYQATLGSISDMQKEYLFGNLSLNRYTPSSGVGESSSGNTYLDQFGLVGSVEPLTAKDFSKDKKYTGRYNLSYDKSFAKYNTTLTARNIFLEYSEAEGGTSHQITSPIGYGTVSKHKSLPPLNSDTMNSKQLLHITQRAFENGKYGTIISRFHTDLVDLDDATQSASSSKYGLSHGRNLLKLSPSTENGYENPYCRVWTYHHQYSQVKDQIRSFGVQPDQHGNNWEKMRSAPNGGFEGGLSRLAKHGVLQYDTGYVKIAPNTSEKDVKKCMFSIENLAWKGVKDLSAEQRGPLGGRIMWFPPYDISFSENVSVNWNGTQFIGRGEQIYTYVNTDRNGTLNWKVLIDHPSILDYWDHKNASYSDQASGGNVDTVDNTSDPEQELLRFFAGCEILNVGNGIKTSYAGPVSPKQERVVLQDLGDSLSFYVFFPNDYSGVDDKSDYAMRYLVNGYGTCKTLTGGKLTDTQISDNTVNEISSIMGWSEDHKKVSINGYEMVATSDYGISGINKDTSFADSLELRKLMHNDTANVNIYTQYRHGHRVDKKNEKTKKIGTGGETAEQYLDLQSFGLNSAQGYKNAVNDLDGSDNADSFVSMADVYAFFNNSCKSFFSTEGRNYYSEENQAKLRLVFNERDITSISVMGYASGEKTTKENWQAHNNELAKNRAKTVANWIRSNITSVAKSFDTSKIKVSGNGTMSNIGNNLTDGNHSAMPAKESRCVKVTISFSNAKDKNFQSTQYGDGVENIVYGNPDSSSDSQRYLTEPSGEPDAIINATTSQQYGNHDDEYQFFQKLEENSPLMRHRISEKIKYFDPAFHSVSPEGFNARLTFLHQCTRQGPTISSSDNGTDRTANNLSFGRPPVCVLRIGDFYYTKIVITSISISYDPLVWDLNDEGIGVMPMIASITMQFNFIGGSDLQGPIERLQNAVSFNYYANTGVYDNRSEMVEYGEDGTRAKFKAFVPQVDEAMFSQVDYQDANTDESAGANTVKTETVADSAATEEQKAEEKKAESGQDEQITVDESLTQISPEVLAMAKENKKEEARKKNTNSTKKKTSSKSSGTQKSVSKPAETGRDPKTTLVYMDEATRKKQDAALAQKEKEKAWAKQRIAWCNASYEGRGKAFCRSYPKNKKCPYDPVTWANTKHSGPPVEYYDFVDRQSARFKCGFMNEWLGTKV